MFAEETGRTGRVEAGRVGLVVLLLLALLVATVGYGAYGVVSRDRPGERDEGPAAVPAPAGLQLPPPGLPPVVLEPAPDTRPRPGGVAAIVADDVADPDLGRHLGVAVANLASGRRLLSIGGRALFTPASTMKLLTTTAALRILGPDHRFTTRVVRSGRTLVLVGGGDPLLARRAPPVGERAAIYPPPASLADLAARTAVALRRQAVTSVKVGVDASLFRGPSASPRWEADYLSSDVVSPIVALWVDEGREQAGLARRSTDPVLAAGLAFTQALQRRGVEVRGEATRQTAPAGARVVARARSAPLAEIAEHVLGESDNEAAEVLLRQAAIGAGLPGSFTGGVRAVRSALAALGIDLTTASIYDGSGLSRADALPLRALLSVLELAADPDHPELRSVATGLPVAGFTGSLADRFVEAAAEPGQGYVRAKTGTLRGVHGLAGIAQSRDGDLLAFAALADRVRLAQTLDARAALDRVAAALSACGC